MLDLEIAEQVAAEAIELIKQERREIKQERREKGIWRAIAIALGCVVIAFAVLIYG